MPLTNPSPFSFLVLQARENLDVAKARIKEAEKRIDADLDAYIAKAYWTEGRNELRRQVGAAGCSCTHAAWKAGAAR